MSKRGELGISDCATCKATQPRAVRQALGCGYEVPVERLTLWSPPLGEKAYRGPSPTMCAGYTTTLPEVVETSLHRAHWDKGSLVAACNGDQPTEETLYSVLILAGAFNEVEQWLMTPSKDGGGGP